MTASVESFTGLELPDPVGPQEVWLDSPKSRKLLPVGRRGGKTRFALIAAIAGHGPGWDLGTPKFPGIMQGSDVIWIAQDYPNLKRVVWHEEIEPRFGHLPWAELNKQDHTLVIPGLASLFLVSAEAISGIRGMGKNLGGVIVDEAAWLALGNALQGEILLALADNAGWLIIMSTTNAGADGGYDDAGNPQIPSYFNVLCDRYEAGELGDDWAMFEGTAYDNPEMTASAIDELIREYPPGSPRLQEEVFAKRLKSGSGLAIVGLSESKHIVPAFQIPDYWNQWASFDWGYQHPWTFSGFAVDDDGQVYKRDGVTGRLDLPEAIDKKVREAGFDPSIVAVYAGPDVWRTRVSSKGKIQGEYMGPTVAERLQVMGWKLVPAADARVAGLNNFRLYVHVDPKRPDMVPRYQWMDTPNNRLAFAQIARMPLDPKNLEDALKVNADAAGRGGDDWYDGERYGLMARPVPVTVPAPPDKQGVSLGYDFEKRKPRERETAESLMSQWVGETQSTPRYRVPVRKR